MRGKNWFEKTDEIIKTANFAVRVVHRDTVTSAIGTHICAGGLAIATRAPLANKDIELRIVVRDRPLRVRVHIEKDDRIAVKGEAWHRYFCVFTGIAADDWDAIVRFVNNMPEPPDVEPAKVADDNDFRTLPIDLQRKLVAVLVGKKRLTPPEPGAHPLIRFTSDGIVALADGRTLQRVTIESRVVRPGMTPERFVSRFEIWSTGTVTIKN